MSRVSIDLSAAFRPVLTLTTRSSQYVISLIYHSPSIISYPIIRLWFPHSSLTLLASMQRSQHTSRLISRSIRPLTATDNRQYSSVSSSVAGVIQHLSSEIADKSSTVHHGWPGSLYPLRKGLKKVAPRPSREERKLQSLRSKEANKREAELDAFRRRNLQIFIEKFVSDSTKLPYPKFDKIICPPYIPPGGQDGKRGP